MDERIFYAASVHDEAEIDAVVEVLRSGPGGLWPGRKVNAMERAVAERFGKARGLMCNSGSSALYLAIELLDLPRGSEVVTAAVTFSTDIAPLVRAGLVPSFVDVDPDTATLDVDRLEAVITSSPAPTPRARKRRKRASVPELTPTAYWVPQSSAKRASKRSI